VPLGAFIPVLEETGLIIHAGRWTLEQAGADHVVWQGMGLQPPDPGRRYRQDALLRGRC
jgi:EAL domain-containing protein (putative c-di-GMP-specific phosphodiesterase class I)